MKRLMFFCFCLLFIVLSALSFLNFDSIAIHTMESDMAVMTITKPQGMDNVYFLTSVDKALEKQGADIMMRIVSIKDGKPIYNYFKTNHAPDFLDIKSSSGNIFIADGESISTSKQEGYVTYDLTLPSLSQDIAIFNWYDLETEDLSKGVYYTRKATKDAVVASIASLGLDIALDNSSYVTAEYSFWLFGFVPAFLFMASVVFYMLSNAKKAVLKRMDGYSGANILLDELTEGAKPLLVSLLAIIVATAAVSAVIFKRVASMFLAFSLKYFAIGIFVVVLSIAASFLVISSQRRAGHIKGKIPKNGMYNIAMLSKCVILIFVAIFTSIAIRNAIIALHAYKSTKMLSEKVEGYVTVPIYVNNAALDKEAEDGYLNFYLMTVNSYNGILIDSSNYHYDVLSGQTAHDEFQNEVRDYVVVNRNYLSFNPVIDFNGSVINNSMLSDDKDRINVLVPKERIERKDVYLRLMPLWYNSEANVLLYDGASSNIFSYSAEASANNGLIDMPIIIVADEQHLDGYSVSAYISQGAYFIKPKTTSPYTELYPLFKETGISDNTQEVRYVADNFTRAIEHNLSMLRIYGTQTVFLTISLFAMVLFSAKLYCENYRIKIASRMIEGYSLQSCITGHIVLTLFVYGISMSALLILTRVADLGIKSEPMILPCTLLLDLFVTYRLCRRYSTSNLYSIMKGADD